MKAQSLLLAVLFTSGMAFADHHESNNNITIESSKNIQQQNLSRRAYTAPVSIKTENIEGDVSDMSESEAEKRYKTLQLHSLGRKPYSEK